MFAALLAIAMVADSPRAEQLRALEGSWAVERMEQKGKKFPTDLVLRVRLEVRGDTFTFINGQTEFSAKLAKFDPYATPPTIDLTRDVDKQTVLGIYKVEDDTLTVCTNARGERPKDFSAGPDSANILTVYKRAVTRP